MLPKNERLSRKEVERVLAHGKRIRGALFSVTYTPAAAMKCAVVVSKKVAKTAVDRNRTRRRVYTELGRLRGHIGAHHVVVFANPGSTQASYHKVQKDLQHIFS